MIYLAEKERKDRNKFAGVYSLRTGKQISKHSFWLKFYVKKNLTVYTIEISISILRIVMEKNENPLNVGALKPPENQEKKLFSKVLRLFFIFKHCLSIVIICLSRKIIEIFKFLRTYALILYRFIKTKRLFQKNLCWLRYESG